MNNITITANTGKCESNLPQMCGGTLCRLILLYRIKRSDAFNCASFGTHLDKSAVFKSPPNLPHGLNGIIVSHNAVVGKNVTIFHQVTIGEGRDGAPTIGDNVLIGAGAKLIGGITVGDNAKIGAGCIVTQDVPANCTIVMEKPRIIYQKEMSEND